MGRVLSHHSQSFVYNVECVNCGNKSSYTRSDIDDGVVPKNDKNETLCIFCGYPAYRKTRIPIVKTRDSLEWIPIRGTSLQMNKKAEVRKLRRDGDYNYHQFEYGKMVNGEWVNIKTLYLECFPDETPPWESPHLKNYYRKGKKCM